MNKATEHGPYTYNYDTLYRLVTADGGPLTAERYSYDPVGNRLASSTATNWTYNANNELQSYNGVTFQYDLNGNTIQKTDDGAIQKFLYNEDDRLTEVKDGTGGVIATYYYDPFGRRLWKEVGGTKTYFMYADEGLVAEFDGTGSQTTSFGYAPNSTWTTNPLFMKEGSQYYFYHNDHLGTPQMMTAVNGSVVWSAKYEPFGKALIDSASIIVNNLRFPGQYYDVETGLHYNYHRYCDSKTGRYLTEDPLGSGSGATPFTYANGNPTSLIDSLGLRATQCDDCPPDKKLFFDWLCRELKALAKELNTNEDLLFQLAAKEGGWNQEGLGHNFPLNNPFGVNRYDPVKKKASGNKSYPSLSAAIQDWKATGVGIPFGDRVRGIQTEQEFIDALQCKNKNCSPYNSADANWESNFRAIKSVSKYKKACGCE